MMNYMETLFYHLFVGIFLLNFIPFLCFLFSKTDNFTDSTLKLILNNSSSIIWDKVSKDGPSKICGRQPLKNLK